MPAFIADPLLLLTRKLQTLARLDEADREALASLNFRTEEFEAGRYLVREGDDASACCLLVEGYACRHKLADDGGRQIVSFHMAGDVVDLQHLLLARADHNVQALTRALVAWIPCIELKRVGRERPTVGQAMWRETLIEASIFREWVLNVGRRDAKARIAHMLCEFAARLAHAGLGPIERFPLPMTQTDIADATGMTPVHVNRTLRQLREEGVIAHKHRDLQILDWRGLRRAGGFDPAYLHGMAA
jgi:CRP-like cAMP-binding protein